MANMMKLFVIDLKTKVLSVSFRLNPRLTILRSRFLYVISSLTNCAVVRFQFWQEYVGLLQTKEFRNLTLVERWIPWFWRRFDILAIFPNKNSYFTKKKRIKWIIPSVSSFPAFSKKSSASCFDLETRSAWAVISASTNECFCNKSSTPNKCCP